MSSGKASRVGKCYATGPADRLYQAGDPDFELHCVVADHAERDGYVTAETSGTGHRFVVDARLIDAIAGVQATLH